jgi:hypothetical protein
MRRVECEVVHETVTSLPSGRAMPGFAVTCGRCDHCVTVCGITEASKRAGLAKLRDECPEREENFYVDGDE